MPLAHLVPHLDAEIERLQKARDLLALFLLFQESFTTLDAERAIGEHSSASTSTLVETDQPAEILAAVPAPGEPQIHRIKMRRPRVAGEQRRPRRMKDLQLVDTALRGSVPAGPVVVSAADVLKSQAAKAAQVTRAAELRRAGSELVLSAAWRDRSSDMRQVDAMMQRLMHMGDEEADQATAVQLPSMR